VVTFGSLRPLQDILPSRKQKLDIVFKHIRNFQSDILSVFSEIRSRHEYACVLESNTGPERLAELSIIVFDLSYLITAVNNNTRVEDLRDNSQVELQESDPLGIVQKIVESFPANNSQFRFVGGAVGYISFDAIRYWESKALARKKVSDNESYPDIQFGLYDQGVLIDHVNRKSFFFCSDRLKENTINEINGIVDRSKRNPKQETSSKVSYSEPRPNVSQEKFESSIVQAKEYIRDGEIFQVVLSKRLDFTLAGDSLQFYSTLRKLNPSPYMYFLDLSKTKVIGSSPEMLVRTEAGVVETFPIAGTGPRSLNTAENAKLANELLNDPKERAEHLMLVDLGRNDIGRVSEFGSVSVPEFMQIHQYSHVQHIVSHVTGKLRRGLTSFDAIRSIFPAGTLSGAPKIRAIQIIDELESDPRGPYGGAVGYFSFNGNMDSAITIRTMVAMENKASIQVGAGIVADSNPATEWVETDRKAAGLLRALEIASGKEDEK
jgi:anthranilate synthase component I